LTRIQGIRHKLARGIENEWGKWEMGESEKRMIE